MARPNLSVSGIQHSAFSTQSKSTLDSIAQPTDRMLIAERKGRKSGRDNSREPFPFQTREAQAFPPTPSENRVARAPSPAWRLSSPPQPAYSPRLRRSE